MKQRISTLMDGELFDDEAQDLLDKLKRIPGAQSDWHVYHLISDVLRNPGHVHADIGSAMHERLQAEPTVLAPRGHSSGNRARWFALSAAASVMALTLVAWLSEKIGPAGDPQLASTQSTIAASPASYPFNRVNDYLLAHQEYSPGANMQGAASYARMVAGR